MNTTPDPETTLAAGPLDDVDAVVLQHIRHLHEVLDPPPADLADNPNFRGFWYGSSRLFLNAVFLGATVQSTELAAAPRWRSSGSTR